MSRDSACKVLDALYSSWWPIAKPIIYDQTSFVCCLFMESLLCFWFFFHMIQDQLPLPNGFRCTIHYTYLNIRMHTFFWHANHNFTLFFSVPFQLAANLQCMLLVRPRVRHTVVSTRVDAYVQIRIVFVEYHTNSTKLRITKR